MTIAAYRNAGLLESILRALSTVTPRPASEVYQAVLDDFGSTTMRAIYRALPVLRSLGLAAMHEEGGDRVWWKPTRHPEGSPWMVDTARQRLSDLHVPSETARRNQILHIRRRFARARFSPRIG
jgi:Fe2+ or Zn2+ uptake regulation protein